MGEIPLTNVLLSGLLNQTVLSGFRFHDVFVSFLFQFDGGKHNRASAAADHQLCPYQHPHIKTPGALCGLLHQTADGKGANLMLPDID